MSDLHGQQSLNRSDELMLETLEDGEAEGVLKSTEVTQLATSLKELSVLFKDFSLLVVEQGTVLDRIDYKIAEATRSIQKGNVHLKKTLEVEKSMRATKVIVGLGVAIFVCAVILILRWTR